MRCTGSLMAGRVSRVHVCMDACPVRLEISTCRPRHDNDAVTVVLVWREPLRREPASQACSVSLLPTPYLSDPIKAPEDPLTMSQKGSPPGLTPCQLKVILWWQLWSICSQIGGGHSLRLQTGHRSRSRSETRECSVSWHLNRHLGFCVCLAPRALTKRQNYTAFCISLTVMKNNNKANKGGSEMSHFNISLRMPSREAVLEE